MSFVIDCAPAQLSELRFAAQSAAQQINDFANSERYGNLLLYGPPGTGKSQIAKVLIQHRIANATGGSPQQFVIHANDFTKTGVIENLYNIQLCSVDFALVVIDEIDELSSSQLLELRSLLDRCQKFAGVIATTNHIAKLDAPTRSRFKRVEIECPNASEFLGTAQCYLQRHALKLPDDQVLHVIEAAGPDIRDIGRSIDSLLVAHTATRSVSA